MKEVLKYCIWLFKPIFKYGLIFTAILFLIISAIPIYENTIPKWKRANSIKKELKELNIDVKKYELDIYLWPSEGSYHRHNGWNLVPTYNYHFGVINEKGLKDGVGENYGVLGRANGMMSIWLHRWLIGEWNNDTISGQAIEITYLPGDSGGECYQQIIFSSYPEDTLSNNCFTFYHLPYDRSLNVNIMEDSLTKSARQWAIENLNY